VGYEAERSSAVLVSTLAVRLKKAKGMWSIDQVRIMGCAFFDYQLVRLHGTC
jgi:hypothetical protein